MFHRWPSMLDEDTEVLAVQLPGRGARLKEPPYRHMTPLIADLVEAVRPKLDVPFAIFGHSLGAFVGFELTRALRQAGDPAPVGLFVSARSAPQLPPLPPRTEPIHQLPPAQFFSALEKRYGLADRTLQDPDMAAMMYPALRADMEIIETAEYAHEEPLTSRIMACGGLQDLTINRESLEAWRAQTSQGFSSHMLNGNHFYLMSDPFPLVKLVRDSLAGDG